MAVTHSKNRISTDQPAEATAGLPATAAKRRSSRKKYLPYLIVLPALALTLPVLVPFCQSIYYSMTTYSLTNPVKHFIWFENYIWLFTDPEFWNSVRVSFVYASSAVIVELLLGLLIAVLLNQETFLAKIFRPLLLMPLMIAPIIGTLMWKLMMSPEFGVLNYFLSFFGARNFQWASAAEHRHVFGRTDRCVDVHAVYRFASFGRAAVHAGAPFRGGHGRWGFQVVHFPEFDPADAHAVYYRCRRVPADRFVAAIRYHFRAYQRGTRIHPDEFPGFGIYDGFYVHQDSRRLGPDDHQLVDRLYYQHVFGEILA